MIEIRQTDVFYKWSHKLRDKTAKRKIAVRIQRLAFGNPGDVKSVGEGISELRIQFGPGYRVYYKQVGELIIVLLCGGDKSSQKRDIEKAKEIARKELDG